MTKLELTSGRRLFVEPDDFVPNPREHSDYDSLIAVASNRWYDGDESYSSVAELKAVVEKAEKDGCVVLPLYVLDHSGLSFSITSFNDPWDSCQIGYMIYPSGWTEEDARRCAQNELHELSQFANGQVFSVGIEHPEGWHGVTDDSLGGIYADSEDEAIQEALTELDLTAQEKEEIRKHFGIEAEKKQGCHR